MFGGAAGGDTFAGLGGGRRRVGPLVAALNYGLVTIDWAADPVTLRFEVRGTDNETLLDHTLSLSALRPSGGS